MSTQAEVLDFAHFTPVPLRELQPGDVYLHANLIFLRSIVNRDYPLRMMLDGETALHLDDFRSGQMKVARLAPGLEVRLRPLSVPVAVAGVQDIFGWAVVYGTGVYLCANFSSPEDLGRVAVPLKAGPAEFHDREFTTGFAEWRAEWLNARGEPVFAVTRRIDQQQ